MKHTLPAWFRQQLPGRASNEITALLDSRGITTVCDEARCPNRESCFRQGSLTFMILGSRCTRQCRFCAVEKSTTKLAPPDPGEPRRIADTVRTLGIRYAVITSVTRDDLADKGAGQFVAVVACLKKTDPAVTVELLIPDFGSRRSCIEAVVRLRAAVIAHNIETVRRLWGHVKPGCSYERSLEVLRSVKELARGTLTKSSLMVGMGESADEVIRALEELRTAGCDIVTIGQYLAPSPCHYPVHEFIPPEAFAAYRSIALRLGFRAVASAPLVRSSYRAQDLWREALHA